MLLINRNMPLNYTICNFAALDCLGCANATSPQLGLKVYVDNH